jgi:hypothetical protein
MNESHYRSDYFEFLLVKYSINKVILLVRSDCRNGFVPSSLNTVTTLSSVNLKKEEFSTTLELSYVAVNF